MSRKLTILFAPMDGVGHVNACIGLAEVLQSRGHKIVFAVSKLYKGKLTFYGFQEELLDDRDIEQGEKPGQRGGEELKTSGLFGGKSALEKMRYMFNAPFITNLVNTAIRVEPQIKQIVAKHKPDIFILDHFVGSPTIIYSGKPWVSLFSTNPLFVIFDERTPPGGSGMCKVVLSNKPKN